MKIVELTKNAEGRTIVEFHISNEELVPLQKVLEQALKVYPRGLSDESDNSLARLKDINKKIKRYFDGRPQELITHNHAPKTHQCPKCERRLRGDEALRQHLERTHKEQS